MKTQEITKRLLALGNQQQAAVSQRFFKTGPGEYGEGDVFLGIKVPILRKLAKEYSDLPYKDVKAILGSKYHELRLMALLVMVNQFSKGDQKKQKSIYNL
ncbi:hypothetical protein D1AOALGA4SA_2223 [Olavius algarvensis Delta 1 endosymbiont]|nr:hypothetical protein D1AOALGA4SA_2223 [Olavius algarvensis Delta 1 endosymbiont]